LPGRIAASPAGNSVVYASEVGKAYRNMWQIYCAGGADRDSTAPHRTVD
jgi:hypothetical protein